MKRPKLKKIALTIAIIWVLTLGIHIERRITFWPSDHDPGGTWKDFEEERTNHHINISIYPTEDDRYGVPYLLTYIKDRPPYTMTFIMTTRSRRQVTTLQLTSVSIKDSTGSVSEAITSTAISSSHIYDDEMYGMSVIRAEIPLPKYPATEMPLRITVEGRVISDDEPVPFQETVIQRADWSSDVVPGWFIAILRLAFL